MRATWTTALAFVLGCPAGTPPTDGTPAATNPAASAAPTAAPTPTTTAPPSASPPASAAPATSVTAAPTASADDDTGPPWVRGLSSGCTKDDDCIKVRACVSYAIRRDAEATFKERIKGVRFRCERNEGAATKPEPRPACVDGTCKLVAP